MIHGGPCLGKSALSINFAHEVKDGFECIIWIDMREITFDGQFDKVFQKLCATILSELNIDISEIKEDERSVQLERRFRSYASQNQKALIILDNADEFVSSDELHLSRSKALKALLLMISKNAAYHVKIVASSREKAKEISFPEVKNINLLKFSEGDSEEFLEKLLDEKKMNLVDLLVKKCQGIPYVLKIRALALNDITDAEEKADFVTGVQEAPLKAAEGSYSCIIQLFDISFQSLSQDEVDVAKALSVFPASFSFYFAKTLCDKLGMFVSTAATSIKRLRDKGIIDRSHENGESFHPFMKEHIQKKCTSEENTLYQVALITVYIDYLFRKSRESFNNEGSTECVLNFRRNGSILENLVRLLKPMSESLPTENDVRKALERSFPDYFLLLRFLCYLVNEEELAQLFTAFLKFVDGGVSHIIKSCLDELRWKGDEGQTMYRNDFEFVMIERRLLSKQINKYVAKGIRHQPNDAFRDRLEALLEKCKNLPDEKVKAYYMIKTNKLLGQYHKDIGNAEKACEYYLESLGISRENFGDGFFSVDCYERYAVSLQSAGKVDEAEGAYREAYEVAKRSKILSEPKVSNMLRSSGSFLLNYTLEKEKGLELLQQACKLQEKAGHFEKMIPKVMMEFITHDLVRFKDEYTRLENAGFLSVEKIHQFHVRLAENLLYIGKKENDKEKSEEGCRILQDAVELCCNAMQHERAENLHTILFVLKTLIKYDLSKFKNAYALLQKSGFVASETILGLLLPLAEFILYNSNEEGDSDKSEQGFEILQDAVALCCNAMQHERAENLNTILFVLKTLIKYDLSKFKNAYALLQKSGFVASETILGLLLPLAEFILYNSNEEGDSDKSEPGFEILQQAFELCDVKNQKQIFRVLDIASKHSVSKLINYMQEFEFTISYTSSEDFYKFVKFHSLTAKDTKHEKFDRDLAEQKLKERLQVAIVAIEAMSKVGRSSDRICMDHLKNSCRLYKLIATEACHILIEDERKPFAKESLHLKELHNFSFSERDVLSLEKIVNDRSSLKYQQYYKEVCFLSRMYDHMVESGFEEQLEQTVRELKQHHWSKMPEIENKLAICLLSIPSIRESEEGLTLLEKVVVYIENVQTGCLDWSHFYDLRKLIPKFLESAGDKQKSVVKQLCERVVQVLRGSKFEARGKPFHDWAFRSNVC